MFNSIKNFISTVTGVTSSDFMKIESLNKNYTICFKFDSSLNIVQAWVLDKKDSNVSPEIADSTAGILFTYGIDINTSVNHYNHYKRAYATNIGHVGCALKFPNKQEGEYQFSELVLDCHYNKGIYMFSLYSNKFRKETMSLIVGSLESYGEAKFEIMFMMSNSFIYSTVENTNAFHVISDDGISSISANISKEPLRLVTYYSDIFSMVFCGEDGCQPSSNEQDYLVNGVLVKLKWAITTTHLQKWNLDTFNVGEIKEQRISKISSISLKCSLMSAYDDSVPNYSVFYSKKKNYDVFDAGFNGYKSFSALMRSYVGNSVSTTASNVAISFPLIFYIKSTSSELNFWTSIASTNIVGYINMYNMSSGRIVQNIQDDEFEERANYSLCIRRMKFTKFLPVIEKGNRDSYTEIWGFGGYPGLSFKINRGNN